jgi:hypothetical protein
VPNLPRVPWGYAASVSAWTLTVRHGSRVERERLETLEDAVAEMQRRAEEIRAEGPLEEVSMLRDFAPADQVQARLEISGKGVLRPPTAGVDVRGDGRVVAYRGGMRRQEIEPRRSETAFDAVRRSLARR